jgi:hypothetical protein
MNEGRGCNAWFKVDGQDEMIALAEPVFWLLDPHGFVHEGPHRGRMRDGSFEIELIFCTKEDAETAQCLWRVYRAFTYRDLSSA